MALNYAEQWSPELLEILMQGTLTSPFVTSNVRWLDAKTFHFTQMSTSGYKNHNRKGGWNTGTYDQKDVPFTLEHARRLYFHPEYHFQTGENPNARGKWYTDWLPGGKEADFAAKAFKEIYRRLTGI